MSHQAACCNHVTQTLISSIKRKIAVANIYYRQQPHVISTSTCYLFRHQPHKLHQVGLHPSKIPTQMELPSLHQCNWWKPCPDQTPAKGRIRGLKLPDYLKCHSIVLFAVEDANNKFIYHEDLTMYPYQIWHSFCAWVGMHLMILCT
jgi:hypothetical protein